MTREDDLKLDPRSGLTSAAPNWRERAWRYGPLAVWAAVIFIGSTDLLASSRTGGLVVRPVLWLFPHVSASTLRTFQIVVRKLGHLSEYAVLALLAARALRTSPREFLRVHWFTISLALLVVYALTDEFHQSFYPSRTPSIYDSMIDSLGGLTALLFLVFRNRSKIGQDLPD